MPMDIDIRYKDGTEEPRQYHVSKLWLDNGMFCMQVAYRVIHAFPMADIRRIKVIQDPNPGQKPDYDKIRKDHGYA